MDDSQPTTAPVVHPEEEQQASELPALDDTSHPGDWSGHSPAEAIVADPVLDQQVAGLVAAGITMADLSAALQRGASLATYLRDSGTPEIAELLRNAIALKPRCCTCGSKSAVYRNFAEQPFCRPCVEAETPVDTSSALIAASEAQGWAQRQTPTVTPADAVSILRVHADYLDPDGTAVPPADALTAATLRMAAQFLEDVAPEPLPRRQRLHPGLLRQLLLKAEAQQGALGPVDVQFIPAAGYTEQPPPGDACEVLEVDGESVRIHGQGDLTAEAAAAVGAVVRIGREQLAEAWPDGDMP